MSVQPLRVGVIGAGTVGREVVRAFLERSTRLAPPDGAPLVLAAVAEKFTERAIASGSRQSCSRTPRPTSSRATRSTSSWR